MPKTKCPHREDDDTFGEVPRDGLAEVIAGHCGNCEKRQATKVGAFWHCDCCGLYFRVNGRFLELKFEFTVRD